MSLVSLDPARTWQDAFDELARHRGVIGRALAAPAAAIVIANLAVTMPDVGPATLFLTSLLSYAAYLMVAVSCHRILLLGELVGGPAEVSPPAEPEPAPQTP